jgi:Kef-type K+ transport system membrane component KefB
MKVRPDLLFYFLMIALSGCAFFWLIRQGSGLEYKKVFFSHTPADLPSLPPVDVMGSIKESLNYNIHISLVVLILQIAIILVLTKVVGYFLTKIGQPAVIGEIIAGILLGPSLLGHFFPSVSGFLFPTDSLHSLQILGQVGLVLFMFVIGTELDLGVVRKQVRSAIIISHSSIVFPFIIGIGTAYFLYDRFALPNKPFLPFALFIGVSMSVTAFPVLARIIKERHLSGTSTGTMAITCAATADITAWCLLAVVIAIVKTGSLASSLFSIILAVAYVLLLMVVVRPLLKKLLVPSPSPDAISKNTMGFIFVLLLLSAYLAESIGVNALFGAFLTGLIMPDNLQLRKSMVDKIEYISVILFLPLFFVFSGLRTRIELMNDSHTWIVCLGITLTAIIGKFGGTTLSAKFVGLKTKESLALGALMNTRGLMELIILNIGYDLGVLPPLVFTMLILMALITTFMTCPVLDLVDRLGSRSLKKSL